jgi:hypothetical protein
VRRGRPGCPGGLSELLRALAGQGKGDKDRKVAADGRRKRTCTSIATVRRRVFVRRRIDPRRLSGALVRGRRDLGHHGGKALTVAGGRSLIAFRNPDCRDKKVCCCNVCHATHDFCRWAAMIPATALLFLYRDHELFRQTPRRRAALEITGRSASSATPQQTLAGAVAAPAGNDPQDIGLRKAAQSLEANFLSLMLKSAGLDEVPGLGGGGEGEEQFASFLRDEQARLMVQAGGIGLSEQLFLALKKGQSHA